MAKKKEKGHGARRRRGVRSPFSGLPSRLGFSFDTPSFLRHTYSTAWESLRRRSVIPTPNTPTLGSARTRGFGSIVAHGGGGLESNLHNELGRVHVRLVEVPLRCLCLLVRRVSHEAEASRHPVLGHDLRVGHLAKRLRKTHQAQYMCPTQHITISFSPQSAPAAACCRHASGDPSL